MALEFFTYFLVIGACVIVLPRTEANETCQTRTNRCSTYAKLRNDLPQTDISRILNQWRSTRNVGKDDTDRICRYSTDLQTCFDTIREECKNDNTFKRDSSSPNILTDFFKCTNKSSGGSDDLNCGIELTIGVEVGLLSGKIPLLNFIRISSNDKNRQYLIAQVGRSSGCKYVEAFTAKMKDKCEHDAVVKRVHNATEAIRTQFRCGEPDDGLITKCEDSLNMCKRETIDYRLAYKIDQIVWRTPGIQISALIAEIDKERGCQFVRNFQNCYAKVKDQCGENDLYFKPILDTTKLIKSQLACECVEQLNKCKDEGMVQSQMTPSEIDLVFHSVANREKEIDKIGQTKGCKFIEVFEACHDRINNKCNADEENFKPVLGITKIAKVQLKCVCVYELNKCKDQGMSQSKLTQKEIDSVLQSVANREKEIDNIGNERGCKFVEVFKNCQDGLKDRCSANEENFKQVLEITKIVHDRLKCGCASAAASLILLIASILLIFYQKSTL